MTDLTTPAESGAAALSTASGHAFDKSSQPWIVDGVEVADAYSVLDETQLNAFRHASTSGLDVTIAAGEAFVGGWLCRDRTTTVTLPASATTTIYVGYDADAVLSSGQAPADSENIIVGPAGDFGDNDPRAPLYEFVTDSTTVTSSTDLRKLEEPIAFDASNDRVNVAADLAERGSPVATETYVDDNRYTDSEAQNAVTDVNLPGSEIYLPNADGNAGFRVGSAGDFAYSAYNGHATVYVTAADSWFRLRHPSGLGDFFRVHNESGDVWAAGDIDAGQGDHINGLAHAHIRPYVLDSGESLPSDTVTGRFVYDPSREQ